MELAILGRSLGLLDESLESWVLLQRLLRRLRSRLRDDATVLHLEILLF